MRYKSMKDIELVESIISSPGETLLDTIEAQSISQSELSSRMKRPIKTINEIIQGKAAITPETAIQLERVLGVSAQFWIELEKGYRLELAEINEAYSLFEKKDWLHNFPLSEMMKFGWIEFEKNNIIEQFNAILSFFRVSSIDAFEQFYNINNTSVAFRMSGSNTKSPYSINVWLRQGILQANELETSEYNAKKFRESLPNIKSLMACQPNDFFDVLQKMCVDCGVKLVHTPCLPKTRLHGSTRWINGTPLIQLSNQYKRNDIFWFTFFHEVGHILLHGKKDVFVEGVEYTEEGKHKEDEANILAEKYTFSAKEEEQLLSELDNHSDKIKFVHEFAEKINTHPALIVGRLAKKKIVHDSVGWSHGYYEKICLEG